MTCADPNCLKSQLAVSPGPEDIVKHKHQIDPTKGNDYYKAKKVIFRTQKCNFLRIFRMQKGKTNGQKGNFQHVEKMPNHV